MPQPPQILGDDAYLELISFTHPASYYPPGSPDRQRRDANPWAHKDPGWIDFAFLGASTTSIARIINARAERDHSGIYYAPETRGGRTRADGQVLEWVISATEDDRFRGTVPFFCGDVTPRDWRVRSFNDAFTIGCGRANRARGVWSYRSPSSRRRMRSILRAYTVWHMSVCLRNRNRSRALLRSSRRSSGSLQDRIPRGRNIPGCWRRHRARRVLRNHVSSSVRRRMTKKETICIQRARVSLKLGSW